MNTKIPNLISRAMIVFFKFTYFFYKLHVPTVPKKVNWLSNFVECSKKLITKYI